MSGMPDFEKTGETLFQKSLPPAGVRQWFPTYPESFGARITRTQPLPQDPTAWRGRVQQVTSSHPFTPPLANVCLRGRSTVSSARRSIATCPAQGRLAPPLSSPPGIKRMETGT
jgi:hypothetical protein